MKQTIRPLSELMLERKREKRERIQEIATTPRRGRGKSRRFSLAPLPFESDAALFDLCGGADARSPLYVIGEESAVHHLIAPEDFTFSGNLDGILRFVYELRRQLFIDRRWHQIPSADSPALYINFDYVAQIDLKAALILAAELDRLRTIVGMKPVLDDHRWRPEIRATFYKLGLHDIIHADRRDQSVPISSAQLPKGFSESRYQIIKMRSEESSSNSLALEIRDEIFTACQPFSLARPQFYNVLVEAFNNTREHAYPNGSGEDGIPSVRRWWAGALVDHHQGRFELAVYDQGIGIPERFARQHEISRIERMQAGGSGDLLVLQRAAEHGQTSTDDPGRGNGLWQMTELTRSVPGSEVEFTSLQGCVSYQDGVLKRCFVPAQRFCGTMVGWKVPFRSQEEAAI